MVGQMILVDGDWWVVLEDNDSELVCYDVEGNEKVFTKDEIE